MTACQGCDTPLTAFERFTVAHIDGVPLSWPPPGPDDPRAALIRAAGPFCRTCYDARMDRAVVL